MVERFRVLEQCAEQDEVRAEQSVAKRAHSASQTETRRSHGGSSYLAHKAHRPESSGTRSRHQAPRPGSNVIAHTRAPGEVEALHTQTGSAELVVTLSHLDTLKADVAGWIAAASDDADVIEPKPGTRAVLAPIDSPNTLAQKRHAARQGWHAGHFLAAERTTAPGHGRRAVAKGVPNEANQAPSKSSSELDAQLGGLGMGSGGGGLPCRAAAAPSNRSTYIMEGVRRSDATRRRIATREGLYRAIDSLPA